MATELKPLTELAETIDGNTTKSLNLQNEAITIQSNGTSWYIL